jgi:hypothetical protein
MGVLMGRMYIPPEQLPGADVTRAVRRLIDDVLESLAHLDTSDRSGHFLELLGQEASRLFALLGAEVSFATIPYVSELSTAKVYLDEAAARFARSAGDEEDLLQKIGVFRRAVEQLHRVVPREQETQSTHPALMRRASGFNRLA